MPAHRTAAHAEIRVPLEDLAEIEQLPPEPEPELQLLTGPPLSLEEKAAAASAAEKAARERQRREFADAHRGIAVDELLIMVSALGQALDDESPDVRRGAAWALGQIRPRLRACALPYLVRALSDPSEGPRVLAVQALGSLGRPVIGELLRTLAEGSPTAREGAAEALGLMGSEAREALPTLVGQLQQCSYPGVRVAIVKALGKIGAVDKPAAGDEGAAGGQ